MDIQILNEQSIRKFICPYIFKPPFAKYTIDNSDGNTVVMVNNIVIGDTLNIEKEAKEEKWSVNVDAYGNSADAVNYCTSLD